LTNQKRKVCSSLQHLLLFIEHFCRPYLW